jgi:stress response protein YsnF
MSLYKIKDFDPYYHDNDRHEDVKGFDLYSKDEKIGLVEDLLVDEEGRFRYFVVNTGVWIFGKKVLLPIGRARIDYNTRQVYADSLSKEQVENLPEFSTEMTVDLNYEERVRAVYGVSTASQPVSSGVGYAGYESAPVAPVDPPVAHGEGYAGYDSAPPAPTDVPISSGVGRAGYESAPSVPVEAPPSHGVGYDGYENAPSASGVAPQIAPDEDSAAGYGRDAYPYQQDSGLYDVNDRDHQYLKQYEERLIADRKRRGAERSR